MFEINPTDERGSFSFHVGVIGFVAIVSGSRFSLNTTARFSYLAKPDGARAPDFRHIHDMAPHRLRMGWIGRRRWGGADRSSRRPPLRVSLKSRRYSFRLASSYSAWRPAVSRGACRSSDARSFPRWRAMRGFWRKLSHFPGVARMGDGCHRTVSPR